MADSRDHGGPRAAGCARSPTLVAREPRLPDRARRGDRRRRPRRQHGPGHEGRRGRARRAARRRRRRRCSSKVGHDPGLHGRRRERAAVRHVLPADGQRRSATPTTVDAARSSRAALRAGLDGVVARGKAEAGRQDDVRRAGARRRRARRGAGRRAPTSATALGGGARRRRRRAATRPTPMLARKGRASYLGERSVGHQDPGADVGRAAARGAGRARVRA